MMLALVFASAASAQTFPPLTGRVVDAAHLLSPAQVQQLEQLSTQIETASTRQFVVATVPDLQGYPIEDYGYKLGRTWKLGAKDSNNGIILLVAPTEKKVRIEVGYGLEPIMTDAYSSLIIQNQILPKFRDKDMAGGIMAGAAAIGEQMKLPLEAAEARAKKQLGAAKDSGDSSGGLILAFWVCVILFFVLPMIFRRAGGTKYRSGRRSGGIPPVILWGPGLGGGGGDSHSSWSSGGGWGGGSSSGGDSFSGGGGSFGGGGASGEW